MTSTRRNGGSAEALQGRQFPWITQDQTDERLHNQFHHANCLSWNHRQHLTDEARVLHVVWSKNHSKANTFNCQQLTLTSRVGKWVKLTRRSGETRTVFAEDFFRERWSTSQEIKRVLSPGRTRRRPEYRIMWLGIIIDVYAFEKVWRSTLKFGLRQRGLSNFQLSIQAKEDIQRRSLKSRCSLPIPSY